MNSLKSLFSILIGLVILYLIFKTIGWAFSLTFFLIAKFYIPIILLIVIIITYRLFKKKKRDSSYDSQKNPDERWVGSNESE